MTRTNGAWVVMTVLAAVACEQKPMYVDTSGVDRIARTMLTAISSGKNLEKVYREQFTPELRDEMPLEDWRQLASDYRRRLGAFESVYRHSGEGISHEGFTHASILYTVTWTRAEGTMKLTCTKNGRWKVRRFHIPIPTTQPATSPEDQTSEVNET